MEQQNRGHVQEHNGLQGQGQAQGLGFFGRLWQGVNFALQAALGREAHSDTSSELGGSLGKGEKEKTTDSKERDSKEDTPVSSRLAQECASTTSDTISDNTGDPEQQNLASPDKTLARGMNRSNSTNGLPNPCPPKSAMKDYVRSQIPNRRTSSAVLCGAYRHYVFLDDNMGGISNTSARGGSVDVVATPDVMFANPDCLVCSVGLDTPQLLNLSHVCSVQDTVETTTTAQTLFGMGLDPHTFIHSMESIGYSNKYPTSYSGVQTTTFGKCTLT
jgi:hypothetical protein